MHTDRWRMILAASILVIGAAFLLWTLSPSAAPAPARRPPSADAPILAFAEPAAYSASDAGDALEKRIRSIAIEGADNEEIASSQVDALAVVAAERLALLIEPDYDRFSSYCQRLTGREAPLARAEWLRGTAFYEGIRTDATNARVILRAANGRMIHEPQGRFITNTPVDGYGRLSNPAEQGFTAVDVFVPVEGKDMRTMKSLRLYYLMRFGWDTKRSSWQPLQQGMYDPENRNVALLPPPI